MSAKFRQSGSIAHRWVEGDGLLVSNSRGEATVINGMGYWIWSQLEEPKTLLDLQSLVKEQFPQAPDTVEHDLSQFLQRLSELELLEGN